VEIPHYNGKPGYSSSSLNELIESWLNRNKYFPSFFQKSEFFNISPNQFNKINDGIITITGERERNLVIFKYTCLQYDIILKDINSILFQKC
jgi:hypothetical protein